VKRLSPGSCGADWFRPRCGSSVPRNIVDQTIRWRGREWRARVNLTRQPKGIRAAAMRRNSTLRVGRGEPRNRVVTCRSEFARPARRSSREQTFAHWRRGMGSQSSFRQPGLAHSVRQKRYRRGDEKSAGNGLLNSASTRRREPRLSNTRSR